jgi:hypothetical protein
MASASSSSTSTGPTWSATAAPGCILFRSSTARCGCQRPATPRQVELHELSSLPIGTGDPEADGFDQRTLVAARGVVVEARLPWALLGFSDPSSLKLLVEHPTRGAETTDARPVRSGIIAGNDPVLVSNAYEWKPWDAVIWHERRRAGFDDLGATMRELSSTSSGTACGSATSPTERANTAPSAATVEARSRWRRSTASMAAGSGGSVPVAPTPIVSGRTTGTAASPGSQTVASTAGRPAKSSAACRTAVRETSEPS